jgi:hypothetical protein
MRKVDVVLRMLINANIVDHLDSFLLTANPLALPRSTDTARQPASPTEHLYRLAQQHRVSSHSAGRKKGEARHRHCDDDGA